MIYYALIGIKRFILFLDEKSLTLPRPLHSDWICVTLLTTTFDVTVTLLIDKAILREVFSFFKYYHIKLDKLYTNVCYLLLANSLRLLIISIEIIIFRFYDF